MIQCKDCKTEISSDAKSCPKCGAPVKKQSLFWRIMKILFVLSLMVRCTKAVFGPDEPSPSSTASQNSNVNEAGKPQSASSSSKNASPIKFGDTITTPKFKMIVSKEGLRSSVGGSFLEEKAAEGAVYVTIEWEYTNISGKPISAFRLPSLHLKDPAGNKYDQDIGASSSFATELDLNTKVLSDLNPGIKSRAANVFEVAEVNLAKSGWQILIEADENVVLPVNFTR